MKLRPLLDSDLRRVAQIESAAAVVPWPLSQFRDCLNGDRHEGFILEENSKIIGFSIFSLVMDEASLLNIAIGPQWQGRGYGRLLLETGLQAVRERGASVCFLEVRVSNARAQRLYASLGFKVVGGRKDYYPAKQGREDALVMSRQFADMLSSNDIH